MYSPTILDKVDEAIEKGRYAATKEMRNLLKLGRGAKVFRLPLRDSKVLGDLASENSTLVEDMLPFARPPFEKVLVEFKTASGRTIGVLQNKAEIRIIGDVDGVPLPMGGLVVVEENGFRYFEDDPVLGAWNQKLRQHNPLDTTGELARSFGLTRAYKLCVLWLLMHQPKSPVAFRDLVEGKDFKQSARPCWNAQKEITIDLGRFKPKRLMRHLTGRRGVVRAHEVRGHFAHYNLDRNCTHEWVKQPRKPGEPERWRCETCAALRVWRQDFVRGDAAQGTFFNRYNVKV